MAAEDRFDLVVAKAVRACSLPSDGYMISDDDAALITRGFDELAFDSLAFMEFCVSVYLETGIEVDVEQVQSFRTPIGVAAFLRGRR